MQYCNDCFVTMGDNAQRCVVCQSLDIRPFATNQNAANAADSYVPPTGQNGDRQVSFRIGLEDLDNAGTDIYSLPQVRILHYAPGTPEFKRQEKQRKKAERAARRRNGSYGPGPVLAVLAGLLTVLTFAGYVGFNLLPQQVQNQVTVPSQVSPPNQTSAQDGTAPQRPLPEVKVTTTGPYKWSSTAYGQPVRWDSCRPIYWVDNPADELPVLHAAVVQAFDQISAQTGLKFIYGGTTTETYSDKRNVETNSQYKGMNKYWKPVLVTFLKKKDFAAALAKTNNDNPNEVAAFAGPNEIDQGKDAVYVSGDITVSVDSMNQSLASRGSSEVLAVLMHEMGHLVGLAHVSDKQQIMYPYVGRLDLGPGDKQGLALAGQGACRSEANYPTNQGLVWNNTNN